MPSLPQRLVRHHRFRPIAGPQRADRPVPAAVLEAVAPTTYACTVGAAAGKAGDMRVPAPRP